MSEKAIASALETALADLGGIPTAYENVAFNPPSGPYQIATVLFNRPENPTLGDGFYRQRGIFHIALRYPLGNGKKDAFERAGIIVAAFARGLSFTKDGVTTTVEFRPEVVTGEVEADRFSVIVKIRFFANIGS